MKRLALAIALILSGLLMADDYQDWLRSQQAASEEQAGDWQNFRSSQDSLFAGFLEQNWVEFELSEGIASPKPDLPEKIPVVDPKPAPELNDAKMMYDIPIRVKTPDEPVNYEQLAYAPPKNCKSFKIDYFGLPVEFCYVDSLPIDLAKPVAEKSIADAWFKLSNTPWEDLVQQLGKHREQLHLNDWGFCRLLHKIGMKLTAGDPDETTIFIWFMLLKSGYDARLGFENDTVYLMVPTDRELLDTRYLTVEGRTYYILDFESTQPQPIKIKTYEGKYPDANNLLNLREGESPLIGSVKQKRAIDFTYDDTTVNMIVEFNPSLVAFYRNHPMDTALSPIAFSPELHRSLTDNFSPLLTGRTRAQAVNIILRFVQSSFTQGTESNRSADEMIRTGIADSRARTRFFIGMIKLLTDYDVIALDYDGYFAAGVLIEGDIQGQKVDYEGNSYTVCDPFYAFSNIGSILPGFEDITPKIETMN